MVQPAEPADASAEESSQIPMMTAVTSACVSLPFFFFFLLVSDHRRRVPVDRHRPAGRCPLPGLTER
jgi:hypothetical protein